MRNEDCIKLKDCHLFVHLYKKPSQLVVVNENGLPMDLFEGLQPHCEQCELCKLVIKSVSGHVVPISKPIWRADMDLEEA